MLQSIGLDLLVLLNPDDEGIALDSKGISISIDMVFPFSTVVCAVNAAKHWIQIQLKVQESTFSKYS